MKLKVLIADAMSSAAIDRFYKNSIATELATEAGPQELAEMIGEFHGLAVRSRTKVTAELISHAKCLRVIGRAGIGVDNIDVPAATRAGIVVMNTPEGNATTTAEHTLAMMFSLVRHIPTANASTQAGLWEKSKFVGMELSGKTLGVIGCGRIGSIVADRALGLRLKVIVYDPFLSEERARELGVAQVDLDELLSHSDLITLHVPLTMETEGIINAATIARMKPGVRIINCARGGLVVENDLAEALRSGRVAGAAIDVFSTEPAHENVLFGVPGVVATPHLGASTGEAQEKVAIQIADQMSEYLRKNVINNAVNIASLSPEEAKHLAPSLRLAGQLGGFAAQLIDSRIVSVKLAYEGQASEMKTSTITNTALAALLGPRLSNVNVVNAAQVASDRRIEVSETTTQFSRDYQTLISLGVQTETGELTVAGTLYGGNKPRMVAIQGIRIEFELVPQMLYLVTYDKPGVIGAVGTELAEAGVNISALHMGRSTRGGDAIALFGLDGEVSRSVVEKVRALDTVRRVELVINQP